MTNENAEWFLNTCPQNRFSVSERYIFVIMTHYRITHLRLRFFFNLCAGTLGTAATTGLLYQPRMIGGGDYGENGGIKIGRGNRSTRRKPAPVLLCPPQIPHD
jgi:hypothetical protein